MAVAATSAYASLIEPFHYRISETDVFIRDLPERFENFRITQLTDIHHSRILGIDQVQHVVALAQLTKPDMFVLTGDYTTSYRRFIEPCAEALAPLNAPEGVWAVLGNHDHYTDPELTTRALRRHRISVLDNAHTTLQRGPDSLQLSGIDDWTWNATDWTRAFSGLKPPACRARLRTDQERRVNSQRSHARRSGPTPRAGRAGAFRDQRSEIRSRAFSSGRDAAIRLGRHRRYRSAAAAWRAAGDRGVAPETQDLG